MMGQSGVGNGFGRSFFFDDSSLSKSVLQLAAEVSDHTSDWLLPLDDFPSPPKPQAPNMSSSNGISARPPPTPPKPKKPSMASSMYGGLHQTAARPNTAPATAVVAPQIKKPPTPSASNSTSPRCETPKKLSGKSEYEALKEEMEKRERELEEIVLSSNGYSWCRSYSRSQTPTSQSPCHSSNGHLSSSNSQFSFNSPSPKELRPPTVMGLASSRPTSRAGTPSGSVSRIPVPSAGRRHTSVAPGLRIRRS